MIARRVFTSLAPISMLAVVVLAGPAYGLAILADDRQAHAQETACNEPHLDETYEPDFFLAAFDAPFGLQDSSVTVDADGLGFRGTVRAGGRGYRGEYGDCAEYGDYDTTPSFGFYSEFSITFRIDGDGMLTALGRVSSGVLTVASFSLLRDGSAVVTVYPDGPIEIIPVDPGDPGFLEPGVYELRGDASSFTNSSAHSSFDFWIRDTAVPIPEPATAWLLVAGLVGLTMRRGGRAESAHRDPR